MLRLPIPDEFNRTGGAGVYYHVSYFSLLSVKNILNILKYDLVGPPRDYKWITVSRFNRIVKANQRLI